MKTRKTATLPKSVLWIGACISSVLAMAAPSFAQDPIDGADGNVNASIKMPKSPEKREFEPTVKFESISNNNADKIVHHEDRFAYAAKLGEKGLKFFGANVDRITGNAAWVRYNGVRALGMVDWQANDQFSLAVTGGASNLKLDRFQGRTYDVARTLPMWKLRSVYKIIPGTELRLEGNNDFTFMGWLDRTDTNSQLMAVQNTFAEIESFSVERWQFRSNVRFSQLEDTNLQQSYDHQILRDVATGPFTLRAGAGGGWTRYREQWPGYWNPKYFEYYGLRVIAIQNFNDRWSAEARFSYGYHREINRVRGVENASELHIRYKSPSNWAVHLNGSNLDSEDGGWWRNDYSLYLEIPI